MKTIILVLALFSQLLSAKTLSASYEVSFGVFQTMGIADARLELNDDQTYRIRIDARTTGLAKVLSNNRTETYESRGIVRDGKLIPNLYTKVRKTNSSVTVKTYTFDHPNKIVWKETLKHEDRSKEQNEFYASEDILTLFFNIKYYMKTPQNLTLYAIGGNGKDGRIDILYPRGKALETVKKTLDLQSGDFLQVVLNDRIFSSANGELQINLASDGLCEKAVLEDVLLFGDIVGQRIHSDQGSR
ncbi:MAG: DUF3108 domain-containing protein [Sulfuricurvum sp.]